MSPATPSLSQAVTRRKVLQTSGAALSVLAAPAIVRAQGSPKIRIGYWPIAAGLPFYAAVELGYFKEAGVNVAVLRFAAAQQIMEAMLSDRADGSANGTGSGNLAIGELAAPGSFKIFCANPSNAKFVLDEMLVPEGSSAKTMADLKGKRVGSGPGIQNTTLARTTLERGGATGATVVELPISQHVAALAAGPMDAERAVRVAAHLQRTAAMAALLDDAPLDPHDEIAEIYSPAAFQPTENVRKQL